jgi:hypothetical protein
MCGKVFGPLGALGGDDDPLLGEEILAQFGHVYSSDSIIGAKAEAP